METTKPTMVCNYCKTDIPKGARICPNCHKDLGNFFVRHPIITIILLLFIIGQIGAASIDKHVASSTNTQSTTNSPAAVVDTASIERAKVQAEAKEKLQGLKITKSTITNEYGYPHLNVTIRNDTGRDIDAYTISATFTDNFNAPLTATITGDASFGGVVQKRIPKGGSNSATWQLSLFENATKVNTIEVTSLHFPDKDETVELR